MVEWRFFLGKLIVFKSERKKFINIKSYMVRGKGTVIFHLQIY